MVEGGCTRLQYMTEPATTCHRTVPVSLALQMRLSVGHDNPSAAEESLMDTTDLRSHSLIEDGTVLTRTEDILHTNESRSAG